MKKLSLEELKDKLTVINENALTQAISGGEEDEPNYNPFYWAGYYTHALWDWLTEE